MVQSLQGVGPTVIADKTAAWTRDPSVVLSPRLQKLRTERCKVLGATGPWLDPDGGFSGVAVHTLADGQSVVESAKVLVTKVLELRAAGSFLLLRAFSQGHVPHLLGSNHEGGDWAG